MTAMIWCCHCPCFIHLLYICLINADSNTTFTMKKDRKQYYFGVNKANNSVRIATSMQDIGVHIGVCATTITRKLKVIPWYENDEYIIGKCIGIQHIKRGFGRVK